jgi:excisionase family DNA binding protein
MSLPSVIHPKTSENAADISDQVTSVLAQAGRRLRLRQRLSNREIADRLDALSVAVLATAYNIPNACNKATADCIISSLLLDAAPQALGESPNNNLLTVRETADYLRVPLSSLYYLVQRGQIPAIQIGGRWRIKKSSLEGDVLGVKTRKC